MAQVIVYGESCKDDLDCESNICELEVDKNGNVQGRKCISKESKWHKKCNTHNDCPSGECVVIKDNNTGHYLDKRCLATNERYDPKNESMFGEDPGENTTGIVNDTYRQTIYKQYGLGPLGKFIIKLTEALISVIKSIGHMLWSIFMSIFNLIWRVILGHDINEAGGDGMTGGGPFGGMFFGLIHAKGKKNGKCFSMYWFRTIVTILLPPFGVFLSHGLTGIPYILLCSLLTAFFYFPGLIYAFAIINNSHCGKMGK
jgi:uncharacterized membrane protein YqaE (UPF0057 family)